jgi:hypothetical protein
MLDGRVSIPWRCKGFLFPMASSPPLGPTYLPIQWVPAAVSLGVKLLGREATHSPSSSEFENGGAVSPLPSYVFMK